MLRSVQIRTLVGYFLLAGCTSQDVALDYMGQAPQEDVPLIFAPGIVSLEGPLERVPAFSPDGNEMFFAVTTADWAPTVFHSVKSNGHWSTPDTASFSKVYNNTEPFFSPDGQRLYFASNRPPGTPPWNDDIWMVERRGDAWSEPQHLGAGVNSASGEFHPSVTADGTLYFASTRDAERTGADIYRSRRRNGAYQPAERLGPSVNSDYHDWDPYASPAEDLILFKSDRPGGFGDLDVYVSFRRADGSWTMAQNLGPGINTEAHDDAADLSPDGRYLFFARRTGDEEMDIYWMDARFIRELATEAR